MDRDTAIEIKDVSKSYKSVKALRDISFNIRKGELFGLIGPDGAGKTTLFRILTTLTLPDSGSATVIGLDVVRVLSIGQGTAFLVRRGGPRLNVPLARVVAAEGVAPVVINDLPALPELQ